MAKPSHSQQPGSMVDGSTGQTPYIEISSESSQRNNEKNMSRWRVGVSISPLSVRTQAFNLRCYELLLILVSVITSLSSVFIR